MILKLVSKSWCHFVSNLQRHDFISAHVPKRVLQFTSVYRHVLYIGVYNLRNIASFFFVFGAILKPTHNSFKKGMLFCLSVYMKTDMKLPAFIFE